MIANGSARASGATSGKRPNIVLILVDDMGFADLGIMGSEIRTPNIDRLARGGVLMSSMYNCARCCPTRASLLTGLYPHKAGIGHMTPNLGVPAYQGFLRNDTVTIAEALRLSGYRTVMSGKWHVGGNFIARDAENWTIGDLEHPTPRQRGFDRFFGIVDGGSNYFSPHYLIEDDSKVEVTADNFYFTDAITDKAIKMTGEGDGAKPFFLYLAHTAPHWPLQAPAEDIARYEGMYLKGWDQLRANRHEEMQAAGVLRHRWAMSPRDASAPAWVDINETDWEAARMAVYAAQVDRLDQSVGPVGRTFGRGAARSRRAGRYPDPVPVRQWWLRRVHGRGRRRPTLSRAHLGWSPNHPWQHRRPQPRQ